LTFQSPEARYFSTSGLASEILLAGAAGRTRRKLLKTLSILAVAAALSIGATVVHAQMQNDDQGSHHMSSSMEMDDGAAPAAGDTASTTAFKKADMEMMKGMEVLYTGDPDVDFRRKMIPHHQGAIDMAKAALRYGNDPRTKALAKKIIAAQEKEIAEMNAWLKKHGR
jgi:uncharacterized protein (DUF305 family)